MEQTNQIELGQQSFRQQVDPVEAARFKAREAELLEKKARLIREKMSPPGTLGLGKVLEAARQTHGIPDSAFRLQAAFHTVLVLQIDIETYKESLIQLAESTKDRELRKSCYGIIVSAGLSALDVLRSHGMDLGHKVAFVHAAPYFVRYDNIGGVDQHLVVLQDSQIRVSFDLALDLKERRAFVKQVTDSEGNIRHVLVDEDRNVTVPQNPEVE